MEEPIRWGVSRYFALLVAVALHVALIAALMMTTSTGGRRMSMDDSVALIYIPPVTYPKVRSENAPRRRLSGDTAVPIAPPVSVVPSASRSPRAASSSGGNGLGIDWAAEARRALQAYEIRNYQPPINTSVSRKPWEEYGWPQAQHQAGDGFRAPNGDWMVWINASCYQLASAGPKSYGVLPRTTCTSGVSQ